MSISFGAIAIKFVCTAAAHAHTHAHTHTHTHALHHQSRHCQSVQSQLRACLAIILSAYAVREGVDEEGGGRAEIIYQISFLFLPAETLI